MNGPFSQLDYSIPISDAGSCTGTDSDTAVVDGTNAQGGYGRADWSASMSREIEFLAPGVLVHRGVGSTRVTVFQRGVDNGRNFQYHPYVESFASDHLYRVGFTVDAPTPIKLKAQVTALLENGISGFEDSFTLHTGSTVLWRLDGTLNPGIPTIGEFEYVLMPDRSYYLQFKPFARAILGACGGPGCSGNPDLAERFREDFTDWSYELIFNYAPPIVDLASLTLNQSEVAGCKNVTGKITLTNLAPDGGFNVTLADTLAAAVTPAVVTVPAGALTKSFSIKTTPVASVESGHVSATGTEESLTQALSVRPIGLASVSLTPTTVVGGNAGTGKATLECDAAPGPITVDLESSNGAIASPVAASIVVPQAAKSASFEIATDPVLAKSTATISGTANGITKTKKLTVTAAASVGPTSLKFGNVSVGQTSAPLNVTLTNKGAEPFMVDGINVTGTAAGWFAQTNDCPAALAAGASCTVSVTFTPLSAARKSAKLSIATSATGTPLSVSLSGTGVLPP